MTYETRTPTEANLEELRQLIDAQESWLDPKHKPASSSWPFELLRGQIDEPRNLVWTDESDTIHAWASLQPDLHRRRLLVEMFRKPNFSDSSQMWDWCLRIAGEEFAGWTVWPTINYRDTEMADVLARTSFGIIRRYFLLTRPLHDQEYPELPEGVSIDVIENDTDFAEWHVAHQDAFSTHFGFTPRPADQWIPHFRDADAADPAGRFLLRVDGVTVGFVTCSLDNAHENGGYIDLLGVRQQFQRRGYGELLVNWAFAYSAAKGFTDIDLSVDTGNESGALSLYERAGFVTLSEFHLYEAL